MSLYIRPWTITQAKPFVRMVHRRLPETVGALWAVRVCLDTDDYTVGCALVGLPVGAWSDVTLSVIRCAVITGHRNACSMLYGTCSRMARDAGADNLVTYLHQDEHGASLKASGWVPDGFTDGGEHDRPSRPRPAAVDAEPKQRWWAPWSKRAQALATQGAA